MPVSLQFEMSSDASSVHLPGSEPTPSLHSSAFIIIIIIITALTVGVTIKASAQSIIQSNILPIYWS